MKKKYIGGIAALVILAMAAVVGILLNVKYTLNVSAGEGCTVSIKDVNLDDTGKTSVSRGKQIVFAVTLDKDYSDSDVKVKVNDEQLTARNGVYRYTVEKNTKICIEGVAKNDYIVSGIDVEPGTMDGEEFTLLRDEKGKPVPVLSDISLNGVDTYDVPDLDLTASVVESINPGWKYRNLSDVNLGKYKGLKFFVKNSNFLQAKAGSDEDFYIGEGSESWNEFLFKYEEGIINLYINGQKKESLYYLSDMKLCLQEEGSYKFSNIYVIERDDYKGAKVTVQEGDGYYFDIQSREYMVNAKITFHLTLDDDFQKSAGFAVKAGNTVLSENEDGSYSFVLEKDTVLSVSGVVAKPLDAAYQTVGMPFYVEAQETANYAMVQSVKNAKTYAYSQSTWGNVGMPEINLEKYSSLLFFIKKDDVNDNTWISMMQKSDDGKETQFLATRENRWNRIEFKKENGKIYLYVNGEKNDTPVIDADHFKCALNENSQVRFTSLVGIVDANYKEPALDYISSAYEVIDMPILVEAKEIENYELVKQVVNAKTYQYITEQWCKLSFNNEINFDKYTDMVFFIRKDDASVKHWLVFTKTDKKGNQLNDYISTNASRWFKVELKKVSDGKFTVSVNGKKQEATVSGPQDLKCVFNEESTILFTSLMGIRDKNYKEKEPDYISSEYQALVPVLAPQGKETDNYERLNKVKDAKTYEYTTTVWGTISLAELDIIPYQKLTFFLKKEDKNPSNWLEFYAQPKTGARVNFIQDRDNQWYEIVLKKQNGVYEVYVNGEKKSATISSMSDLKITLNGNSTLKYTSICGIADPNYQPVQIEYLSGDYQVIAPALAVAKTATEIDNYEVISKITDSKTYSYTADVWGKRGLADIDIAPYKSLVFYMKKADYVSTNWLQFSKGEENYLAVNDNAWYKLELRKNSTGTFDVYVDGVKKGEAAKALSDVYVTINAASELYFTSLFGIADPDYKEPEAEVKGILAAMTPWAYGEGKIDNSQTAKKLGYTYATIVTGNNTTYQGTLMSDLNLSEYASFRFALKSPENKWWEIGYTSTNTYTLTAANFTAWTEYEFINDGNGNFEIFCNGESMNLRISENLNLSDLQMKFGNNGTLYMTEVRGVLKEGETGSLKMVATNFNHYTGTFTDEKIPLEIATGITKVTTTWTATKYSMTALSLDSYEKVLFYARKTDGSGYFESNYFGSCQLGNNWVEFKLIKNAEGTWNLYRGGKLQSENISLTNLSEVTATYGTATYEFSQVFAVEAPSKDTMAVITTWAFKGVADTENVWTAGGYSYVTKIDGGNDTYAGALFNELELSDYEEIRFAIKSDGTNYYEICKTEDNYGDNNIIAGCTSKWIEVRLKDEGNGYYQLYVQEEGSSDNGWKNVQLPLTMNLSDLKMKFATAGTMYITEVRGILREDATSSVITVADCIKTGGEIAATVEKPVSGADKITKLTTEWNWEALMDLSLDSYCTVKFYVRNTTSGEAWFELKTGEDQGHISEGVRDRWIEVRLVRNSDDTWSVYVAGKTNDVLQKLSITNLNQLKANFGTNTWYLSEVFGIRNVSVYENGESLAASTAWTYEGATEDATQTYSEKGYKKATVIVGSTSTYSNPSALSSVKLADYQSVRFAFKSDGTHYWELFPTGKSNIFSGNSAQWQEISLVNEGNGYFQAYRDGSWVNVKIPLDADLSDYMMKYANGGTLVVTEVIGKKK